MLLTGYNQRFALKYQMETTSGRGAWWTMAWLHANTRGQSFRADSVKIIKLQSDRPPLAVWRRNCRSVVGSAVNALFLRSRQNPLVTGWSISEQDADIIRSEIRRFEQRRFLRVVEFGCGYSTLVLLNELDRVLPGNYDFLSLEEESSWCARTEEQVRTPGRSNRFTPAKTSEFLPRTAGMQ